MRRLPDQRPQQFMLEPPRFEEKKIILCRGLKHRIRFEFEYLSESDVEIKLPLGYESVGKLG